MKKTTPALALVLCVSSLVLINPVSPAQAETIDVADFADSHVAARHPNRNHGHSAELRLTGTADRRKRAFLKFRIPPVEAGADLDRVTLRLRALDSSARGIRVYRTGRGWAESTLTWRQMPATRSLLGRSDALQAGTTEVIDLNPALVSPGEVLAIRLATSAQTTLSFASKEAPASARPTMDVTVSAPAPAPTPTPTPVPAPIKTMIGACPAVGSPSLSVVSKYGTGASVRLFVPGGFNTVARPAGASKVHVSWKPTLGSTITDTQLVAAFANLKDGDLVEVWHESDVKYRKGDDLAAMLAMKNQFHDRVVALRNAGRIAKVLTVNTWAGWSVDSTSSVNPANLHARADLLGIDMDGIPAADTFYPYAARQMGAKFISAYKAGGYTGWTVPEFTMPAVAADPTHVKRTAWFQSEVATISQGVPSAGVPAPTMIAWFDDDWASTPENDTLHAANEIAAWSALVARTQ